MNERASLLMYAIRGPVILKYAAQLILVQAGLVAVPALVALLYQEYGLSLRFAMVAVALAALSRPFVRWPAPAHIQVNEALTVTVIAFLVGAVSLVYPFMGAGLPFLDALFEAVSGITTTGLTTLSEVEDKPKGFLFARSWMQWYGGLGFVVLVIALLMGVQPANRRLLGQELERENAIMDIHSHARQVTQVYLILTLIPMALLYLMGVDGLTAVVHVLSAVSTGGFSNFNDSLAGLNSLPAEFVVSLVVVSGAISLPLYYRFYRHGLSRSMELDETLGLMACLFFAGVMLILSMHIKEGMDWDIAALQGAMLAMSAQTTTGFSSLDITRLDAVAKVVMIVAMATGGAVGSTAGGLKILRVLILLKLMHYAVQKPAMPDHSVLKPRLAGKTIAAEEINGVLTLLGWGLALMVGSWLPFVAMGYHPLDSLFEVVSALATTGLSSGITRADLQPALKLILCFDMLAGRLEIVALLVFLYPKTWFGRRVREL
ncbi:TrkH family potassium uptake protein [Methylobacter sp. BBA5.1]|uniref:TrkH family potassium uptake protein n=1 Tax=Methylobacter sp. BBA5.1 TaxID=1495064 RepID=UPI00068B039B|nr:potassium transporter TrkG [Methylobacter sp. BBA5.1]